MYTYYNNFIRIKTVTRDTYILLYTIHTYYNQIIIYYNILNMYDNLYKHCINTCNIRVIITRKLHFEREICRSILISFSAVNYRSLWSISKVLL